MFGAHQRGFAYCCPDLATLVKPLLIVCRVLYEQISILHLRLLATMRENDVCQRL
jgi:hypothetical protein